MFLDESGVNTKMARPKGQRLVASIPHGHWTTNTFIAGLRHDRIVAPWLLNGPMNGDAFLTYIATQLAPCLSAGDIVLLTVTDKQLVERAHTVYPELDFAALKGEPRRAS